MNFLIHIQPQFFVDANSPACGDCISLAPQFALELPEPASLALLGLGIIWLGIRMSRARKQSVDCDRS